MRNDLRDYHWTIPRLMVFMSAARIGLASKSQSAPANCDSVEGTRRLHEHGSRHLSDALRTLRAFWRERLRNALRLSIACKATGLSLPRFRVAYAGATTSATPIMLSRVTSKASAASAHPSVPAGRSGKTR